MDSSTLYLAAALLALTGGAGGIIVTVINFAVLLHHQTHLARRLRDVKDDNARLRGERLALTQQVADLNLKLEMVIIENAKLSSK